MDKKVITHKKYWHDTLQFWTLLKVFKTLLENDVRNQKSNIKIE